MVPFYKCLPNSWLIDISIIPGIVSGMKSVIRFLILVFFGMVPASCVRPVETETPLPFIQDPTPTPQAPADPVIQPEPTQIPTLTPGVVIENADQSFFFGDWEAALQEYQDAFDGGSDPQILSAALLGI